MSEEKEMTLEQLKEHVVKVRGMVEYHVLSASNYVLQIHEIEKLIEKRSGEESERTTN